MANATVAELVRVAEQEWSYWGGATWNCITGKKSKGHHIDDEDSFAQYVIDTYLPPFYAAPVKWPTTSTIGNDDYAWSAVAMSYFAQKSGFARKPLPKRDASAREYGAWVATTAAGEFPLSQAHADYIRWSIRARLDGVAGASYWGYRVDEPQATPEVGDLVGYARGKGMTAAKALKYFDKTGSYESHTDVVVARRAAEIDVIGGNVRDSVTKKTLALNGAGQLADNQHFWFVVLKRR